MWPLWTVALYMLKLYVLLINGGNETALYDRDLLYRGAL